jgi:hypothetical protein
MNNMIFKLRYRLLAKWWRIRSAFIYVRNTPAVWRSRYRIKKAGYIVRRGHIYRIGESAPLIECNRFGVPMVRVVMMGSSARLTLSDS